MFKVFWVCLLLFVNDGFKTEFYYILVAQWCYVA